MIQYMRINGVKRPVAVRADDNGRKEYCFGLEVWRRSAKIAWADFQIAQASKG
jgi:hypothetical protein